MRQARGANLLENNMKISKISRNNIDSEAHQKVFSYFLFVEP